MDDKKKSPQDDEISGALEIAHKQNTIGGSKHPKHLKYRQNVVSKPLWLILFYRFRNQWSLFVFCPLILTATSCELPPG